MRAFRDDDGESGGFELVGFLAVVVATAIAFFVYSDRTGDAVAHVQFIDPVHAGGDAVSDETTTAIPAGKVNLPATAPAPHARPARQLHNP